MIVAAQFALRHSAPPPSRSLGDLDIPMLRAPLGLRGLLSLRYVWTRLGLEPIGLHARRCRSQTLQDSPCALGIRNEATALDVGLVLSDEPFLSIPRAAAPLARHALNAAGSSHVLRTKGLELPTRPDFDVEVIAAACGPGLCSPPAVGLRLGPCLR